MLLLITLFDNEEQYELKTSPKFQSFMSWEKRCGQAAQT